MKKPKAIWTSTKRQKANEKPKAILSEIRKPMVNEKEKRTRWANGSLILR